MKKHVQPCMLVFPNMLDINHPLSGLDGADTTVVNLVKIGVLVSYFSSTQPTHVCWDNDIREDPEIKIEVDPAHEP